MQKLQRIYQSRWFPYACVFLLYLFIHYPLSNKADDFDFQEIYDAAGGVWGWMKLYISTWSGRVFPHGLLMLLMQLSEWVFRALNAGMLTVLVWLGTRYCSFGLNIFPKYHRVFILLFSGALLLLIPVEILTGSVFWKAASVLYLWGLVAVLLACLPFLMEYSGTECRTSTVLNILAPIGAAYASNFEQAGPIVIVFGGILLLLNSFKHKKVNVFHCCILLVAIAGFALSVASPGNALRYEAEIVGHFNFFESYTFVDKLFIGINLVLQYFKEYYALILCAASWMVMYLSVKNKKNSWTCLFACVPLFYYTLMYIMRFMGELYGNNLLLPERLLYTYMEVAGGELEFPTARWLSTFAGLTAFLFLVLSLWLLVSREKEHVFALLLCAAFADIGMMGFSPSVYVSGGRTSYISGVLLIFVLFRLLCLAAVGWNRERKRVPGGEKPPSGIKPRSV